MIKKNVVEENKNLLPELDFCASDKFAKFLIFKLNWTPLRTALTSYVLAMLSSLIIAALGGRLFPSPDYTGLLVDYFYFLTELLVPLVWGYYLWIYKAPYDVFSKLTQSNIIRLKHADAADATTILRNVLPTRASLGLSLVVGGLYFYQGAKSSPVWFNSDSLTLGFRSFAIIAPAAFAAWSISFRLIVNAQVFKRILKEVDLHPLHPDNAGGLRPLGQYALRTTYLIAFGGSMAALAEYVVYVVGESATAYFFHFAVLLYLILAPLSFFAPLWAAHDAMSRAKDRLLEHIARQFKDDFSAAFNEIKGSSKSLKDNIEKIEQLQKLHHLAVSFPVWPFDSLTLRRFFLTISSPIATVVLSVLIDYLTRLI